MSVIAPNPANSNSPSPVNKNSGLNINEAFMDNSVIYTNVGQGIVITTEDKLELCLRDHQDILKAKNDWITPVGLFLALLICLVTCDFKTFLGVKADLWNAIFLICCAVCFLWSIKSIFKAIKYKNSGSMKQLIQTLKNSSQNLNNNP